METGNIFLKQHSYKKSLGLTDCLKFDLKSVVQVRLRLTISAGVSRIYPLSLFKITLHER